jgi:putative ABC transport system substrate-binding protein
MLFVRRVNPLWGKSDTRRDKIISLSAHLPTMYQLREHAAAGGLMSYGIDLADLYRQVGI